MIFKSNLFYLLLFTLLLVFVFAVPFNGLYGQDAYEYFRYTKALHNFFVTGKNPGDYVWSYMYPLAGSFVSFIFSVEFSLQVVSMLSFMGVIYFTEKIILLIYKREQIAVRIFLLLFLFLSPFALRIAVTDMSDAMCLFFLMACFYFFINQLSGSAISFLWTIVFAAAAFMTRYAACVVLFIPILFSVIEFVKNFNWRIFFAATISVVCILIPYFFLKDFSLSGVTHHVWLIEWNLLNLFKRSYTNSNGIENYSLPNIIYSISNSVSPGFLFVGCVFLFFISKADFIKKEIKIILCSWIMYALFLGGIPNQNNRYLFLTFPLVLILLFPAALRCWNYFLSKIKNIHLIVAFVCIVQLALFTRAFMPFFIYNKTEKQIISDMRQRMSYTVYTTGFTSPFRAYEVPHKVIDLWASKIDTIEKPALLLVNIPKFKKQWTGMNVMINYNFILAQSQLVRIKGIEDGWELYEIK